MGPSTWDTAHILAPGVGMQPYKALNLSSLRPRQTKQVMDQRLWILMALVVLWGDSGAGAPWGPTRCMPIPQAMALCHDIGYTEMQLPNLLDHDTAAEAIQQSVSWLPLLARECHPDARLFLCSLPLCALTGRAGAPRLGGGEGNFPLPGPVH